MSSNRDTAILSVQITNIETKILHYHTCFEREYGSNSITPAIQICGNGFVQNQSLSCCVFVHGVFPYFYFR